jgi:hypothetical protein
VVAGERAATGRERHDHKITVYLSASELLDLEHARLALRRLGVVIDRGRLVRETIAVLLADLDARGKDSLLAHRLGAGIPKPAVPEQAVPDQVVSDQAVPERAILPDGADGTEEALPSLRRV